MILSILCYGSKLSNQYKKKKIISSLSWKLNSLLKSSKVTTNILSYIQLKRLQSHKLKIKNNRLLVENQCKAILGILITIIKTTKQSTRPKNKANNTNPGIPKQQKECPIMSYLTN